MGKLLKVGSSLSSIETKEPRERKSVGWATERSGRIAQHFSKSPAEGALRSEENHPAFSQAGEDELPWENHRHTAHRSQLSALVRERGVFRNYLEEHKPEWEAQEVKEVSRDTI